MPAARIAASANILDADPRHKRRAKPEEGPLGPGSGVLILASRCQQVFDLAPSIWRCHRFLPSDERFLFLA
jgi:hypothetical protein